jgi:cbb3-type cytochrome oxidase cytochrome c subunit
MKGFINKASITAVTLSIVVFLTSLSFATNTNLSASTIGHKSSILNKDPIKNNDAESTKTKKIYSAAGCMACHHN